MGGNNEINVDGDGNIIIICRAFAEQYPDLAQEGATIVQNLYHLAKVEFLKTYGYPFEEDHTAPPNVAPGAGVHYMKNFVSVEHGNKRQAGICFQKAFAENKFPQWAIDKVLIDIDGKAAEIFSTDAVLQFKHLTLSTEYEGSKEGEGNIKVDAVAVYVNAEESGEGTSGTKTYVYYAGVFYDLKV